MSNFTQECLDEGIVLHSTNCRDYDRLITVFTKSNGVIKCYVRGANKKKSTLQAVSTPLSHVEIVFAPSRGGDLYSLCEGKVLNSHVRLRRNWESLNAACEMAQALRKSQYPGKASSALYSLFCIYLENISKMQEPHTLAASFFLKLLRHDGLLALKASCSICRQDLIESGLYLSNGESFCVQHALPGAYFLDKEESHIFQILAHCKNFKEMTLLSLRQESFEKAKNIFKSTTR